MNVKITTIAASGSLALLLLAGCASSTTSSNPQPQKAAGTDSATVEIAETTAERTTYKGGTETDYALVDVSVSQILTQDSWTMGSATLQFTADPATATEEGTVTNPMAAIEAQMETLMGPGVQLNYDGRSFRQYGSFTLQAIRDGGSAADVTIGNAAHTGGYLGGKYASYKADVTFGSSTGTLTIVPNEQNQYVLTVDGTGLAGTWTCPLDALLIGYANSNVTGF